MAKALSNNPGNGVLFFREADGKRPTLEGGVNIDGMEYRIAGWERVSKGGMKFVSLKIEPADMSAGAGAQAPQDDKDLPF